MRRTFRDQAGREWEVWDVRPNEAGVRLGERRQAERRGAPAPEPALERRHSVERRVRERPMRGGPAIFPSGFESGWLVFATAEERRRLAPLPDAWTEWDDARLAEACARARRGAAR